MVTAKNDFEVLPDGSVRLRLRDDVWTCISSTDHSRVCGIRWQVFPAYGGNFYAKASIKQASGERKMVFMHRFLLSAEPGLVVDHIDGDGLNNRRCNLRQVTNSQNQMNRRRASKGSGSGHTGVTWAKDIRHWRAHITLHRKKINLGCHKQVDDAIAARKAAEAKYFAGFKEQA